MENFLNNQELHEFAQWFSYHYKNDDRSDYPKEDIIDLVDVFIKSKSNNIGFVKWFAEKYEIYGDCAGRTYLNFSEETNWDTTQHIAETTQEWIDKHFSLRDVTGSLLYGYFKDKIKGDLFKLPQLDKLIEKLKEKGVNIIID
jgi:hypothetical protein